MTLILKYLTKESHKNAECKKVICRATIKRDCIEKQW